MIAFPLGGTLDYPITWSLAEGEAISTSTWAGDGLTVSGGDISGNVTSCLLSGGSLGGIYEVTNTILTDQGRTDVRTITFRVMPVEATV